MRVILVLAIIGAASAFPRQKNRIVGGESTSIENYPFMANMLAYWMEAWNHNCGGTLITNTAVVSAAHCLINYPSLYRMRLGSTYKNTGEIVHTVSKIFLHPKYDLFIKINDISIIRLTNPAVFSNTINIARIAGPRYTLPDTALVHAIGWGATEWEGDSPEDLHHVAVNVINHQICIERYAYLKSLPDHSHIPDVTPEMLCTGILDVGGKDACQGDSGGPVVHNGDVLVGITSWGYKCAEPSYPGVNVRVSSYTDWIYTNSIN